MRRRRGGTKGEVGRGRGGGGGGGVKGGGREGGGGGRGEEDREFHSSQIISPCLFSRKKFLFSTPGLFMFSAAPP
jgi:hypothetical protein